MEAVACDTVRGAFSKSTILWPGLICLLRIGPLRALSCVSKTIGPCKVMHVQERSAADVAATETLRNVEYILRFQTLGSQFFLHV
jgi:hypothetical protein